MWIDALSSVTLFPNVEAIEPDRKLLAMLAFFQTPAPSESPSDVRAVRQARTRAVTAAGALSHGPRHDGRPRVPA